MLSSELARLFERLRMCASFAFGGSWRLPEALCSLQRLLLILLALSSAADCRFGPSRRPRQDRHQQQDGSGGHRSQLEPANYPDTASLWGLERAARTEVQNGSFEEPGRRSNKFKRQAAVDSAVERLHILESLDGQLEEFLRRESVASEQDSFRKAFGLASNEEPPRSSRAQLKRQQNYKPSRANFRRRGRETVCYLRLADLFREGSPRGRGQEGAAERSQLGANFSGSCLEDAELARNVPAYMLNLYRQLSGESGLRLADAVRQMPYQSLIMRSFRQAQEHHQQHHQREEQRDRHHGRSLEKRHSSQVSSRRPPPRRLESQLKKEAENSIKVGNHYPLLLRRRRRRPLLREHENDNNNHAGYYPPRELAREDGDSRGEDKEMLLGGVSEAGELARRGRRQVVPALELVVELSALNGSSERLREEFDWREDREELRRESAEGGADSRPADGGFRSQWLRANAACDLGQRKLAPNERQDLCYWFHIADSTRRKMMPAKKPAGSLAKSRELAELPPDQPANSNANSHSSPPSSSRSSSSWPAHSNGVNASLLPPPPAEVLVEAELHVFKLLPQLLRNNNHQQHSNDNQARGNPQRPPTLMVSEDNVVEGSAAGEHYGQKEPARRQLQQLEGAPKDVATRTNSPSNLYHLKTNLLEVSLYQILPKRSQADGGGAASGSSATDDRSSTPTLSFGPLEGKEENVTRGRNGRGELGRGLDKEFPLRLLDIRRIDLDSSGWETFYVKRAVEDWIADASSNLGLVIKAKSMFEEPIRIGLIRFADLYDHQQEQFGLDSAGQGESNIDSDRAREDPVGGRPAGASSSSEQGGRLTGTRPINRRREEAAKFDLEHQPMLVVYTRTAGE